MVEGVPRLRRPKAVRWIRRCIALAHRGWFRVVEFSVLSTHLHLIIEAEDRRALGRGMQGLKIRLARRLNALFGRKGTLFAERYHARQIRTPRQARAALRYVLDNYRRHEAQRGRTLPARWVDPFSSAPFFDGWKGTTVTADEHVGDDATRPAKRWVLTTGWKRRGLLEPGVVPGPGP
jgi:putative transposase